MSAWPPVTHGDVQDRIDELLARAVSVDDAAGDGTTDATAEFSAKCAEAAAKINDATSFALALVNVPIGYYRLSNLVLPRNVILWCYGARLGPVAGMTGALITTNQPYSGVLGASLSGGNLAGASAINIAAGSRNTRIRDCQFDNWDGRAIYEQGVASRISDCFAQNCLLGANTLAGYTGVVELAGTDSWVSNCELTASRFSGRGMSSSGFACALAITGANHMVKDVVAETSDHGVYLGSGASQTHLSGVRGELNYGEGWIIAGGGGRAEGCHALRNSQAGNNLYNGFHATAGNWLFSNCYSESGGGNPTQNYGFLDEQTSQSNWNTWNNVRSIGDSNGYFASNSTRTAFNFPSSEGFVNTSGASFFVKDGRVRINMTNASPTNVTGFTGGVNGQEVIIRGEGQSTAVNSASLVTLSGSNLLLANNVFYRFVRYQGNWYQI